MPELFLILLSGGVMLAAAISDPQAVTLRWLRLAGIIALTMCALAGFFASDYWGIAICFILILAQLAFVQVAYRKTQRVLATLAFALTIGTAGAFLHVYRPGNLTILTIANMFTAAVLGLGLMDMLLGHAYLTASQMTMAPFQRLNRALALAMAGRAVLSIPVAIYSQYQNPIEMFWNLHGLFIGTRWLVGFIVPGVFVYMAHDCIKRRATQSATGILYVAGVLLFIGEIIGLHLIRETGLPL